MPKQTRFYTGQQGTGNVSVSQLFILEITKHTKKKYSCVVRSHAKSSNYMVKDYGTFKNVDYAKSTVKTDLNLSFITERR